MQPCGAFTPHNHGSALASGITTNTNINIHKNMNNNRSGRPPPCSTRKSRSSECVKMWLGGGSGGEKSIEELEEDARMLVLTDRRKTIRGTLRSAEALKNFRVNNGYVPEVDPESGKPLKSDSKLALTLTAFVVAAGAVTLRIGGRAALVSAIGIDFANDNPELKSSLDTFLTYASDLPPTTEALLFLAAWTAVKVFCVDFGGVILALSSGILFGGVVQGAVASAAAATIGSSVAFFLAKAETPVRKKALEIVDEYPSLRGIERVVAQDGLKAILTLRLAPVLPIPIGMYNYVYGVTNVPFADFAGGVFLGSLKPYLLDSYLGVFGKQVVDGTAGDAGGIQDVILLVVLGVSVLIGVFASQLAGEMWDSVTSEVEEQKKKEKQQSQQGDDYDPSSDDGIVRQIMEIDLPLWIIGMQLDVQAAGERLEDMVQIEYNAQVWNYTSPDKQPIPSSIDPAKAINSPEQLYVGGGFDLATNICEGFVLSPCLLSSFLKYADPLYTTEADEDIVNEDDNVLEAVAATPSTTPSTTISTLTTSTSTSTSTSTNIPQTRNDDNPTKPTKQASSPLSTAAAAAAASSMTLDEENKILFSILSTLRNSTQTKIQQLDNDMKSLKSL